MLLIKLFLLTLLLIVIIYSEPVDTASNRSSFRNTVYQLSYSAKDALINPISISTFVLAAGIYLTKSDSRITEWALQKHPIYGSEEGARTASNILQTSSLFIYGFTYVMKNWLQNSSVHAPFLEFSTDLSIVLLTAASTEILKNAAGRPRPDFSDHRSFPSGHTSFATCNMTLASNDIDEMHLAKGQTILLKSGLFLVAAGTAWGRVEGQKHYASDVLIGAAIGYFFGELIDNYITRTEARNTQVSLGLSAQSCDLELKMNF